MMNTDKIRAEIKEGSPKLPPQLAGMFEGILAYLDNSIPTPIVFYADVERLVESVKHELVYGGDGELAIRYFITERLGIRIYEVGENAGPTGPTGPGRYK